jgi:hypothetical protein
VFIFIKNSATAILVSVTVLVSACSINKSTIQYEKSSTTIAVRDGIPVDEARQIIDFIYGNFKDVPAEASEIGFYSLKSISHWDIPERSRSQCKYMAHFEYEPPDKSFIAGDDVCIDRINNELKFDLLISHWMEERITKPAN